MPRLDKLKSTTTLKEVASLLGFKPKALSFILYKTPSGSKYLNFDIPKKSGGVRTISAPAPALKKLQKNLSTLLQDCMAEIDESLEIKTAISHGFRRDHSIITNAARHRNKRYVFNLDLQDFFGTINFGRVRGFLLRTKILNWPLQ
jgi:RNA-directed DNA polymerase